MRTCRLKRDDREGIATEVFAVGLGVTQYGIYSWGWCS
jgi:hypothetical protein